jgi:hypothetical protein
VQVGEQVTGRVLRRTPPMAAQHGLVVPVRIDVIHPPSVARRAPLHPRQGIGPPSDHVPDRDEVSSAITERRVSTLPRRHDACGERRLDGQGSPDSEGDVLVELGLGADERLEELDHQHRVLSVG